MIPVCLERSEDYMSLSDKQRSNFVGRLHVCSEIIDNVSLYARAADVAVLDDIELDAYSAMSLGCPDEAVSPYLVHSSWLLYCSPVEMRSSISQSFKSFQALPIPGCESSSEEVLEWCRKWATAASDTLVRLEKATSVDAALAQCVCVDALMAAILLSCAMRRLNPHIATK